jgi:hypothetical protein
MKEADELPELPIHKTARGRSPRKVRMKKEEHSRVGFFGNLGLKHLQVLGDCCVVLGADHAVLGARHLAASSEHQSVKSH